MDTDVVTISEVTDGDPNANKDVAFAYESTVPPRMMSPCDFGTDEVVRAISNLESTQQLEKTTGFMGTSSITASDVGLGENSILDVVLKCVEQLPPDARATVILSFLASIVVLAYVSFAYLLTLCIIGGGIYTVKRLTEKEFSEGKLKAMQKMKTEQTALVGVVHKEFVFAQKDKLGIAQSVAKHQMDVQKECFIADVPNRTQIQQQYIAAQENIQLIKTMGNAEIDKGKLHLEQIKTELQCKKELAKTEAAKIIGAKKLDVDLVVKDSVEETKRQRTKVQADKVVKWHSNVTTTANLKLETDRDVAIQKMRAETEQHNATEKRELAESAAMCKTANDVAKHGRNFAIRFPKKDGNKETVLG